MHAPKYTNFEKVAHYGILESKVEVIIMMVTRNSITLDVLYTKHYLRSSTNILLKKSPKCSSYYQLIEYLTPGLYIINNQ